MTPGYPTTPSDDHFVNAAREVFWNRTCSHDNLATPLFDTKPSTPPPVDPFEHAAPEGFALFPGGPVAFGDSVVVFDRRGEVPLVSIGDMDSAGFDDGAGKLDATPWR